MGFFDMFKLKDINGELEKAKSINGSIILDVRTISEYKDGHIPNSINIPVEDIESVASKYKDNIRILQESFLFLQAVSAFYNSLQKFIKARNQ